MTFSLHPGNRTSRHTRSPHIREKRRFVLSSLFLLLLKPALLFNDRIDSFLPYNLLILIVIVGGFGIQAIFRRSFGILLRLTVEFHDFVGTRPPLARSENLFKVGWIDDLPVDEELSELLESACILHEHALCPVVFLLNDGLYLLIDELRRCFAIRLAEAVLAEIVVVDIRHLLTHTIDGYHAVHHLRDPLKVVAGSGADMSGEEFLSRPTSEESANLVEEFLFRGDRSFLRHIPVGSECVSTRHDCDFDKRVGMLQEPRDGGMS